MSKPIHNDMALLELIVSFSVVLGSFGFNNYLLNILLFLGGVIYLGVGHVGKIAIHVSNYYRFWYTTAIIIFTSLKVIQIANEGIFLEYKNVGSLGFLVLSFLLFIIWRLDLRKKLILKE